MSFWTDRKGNKLTKEQFMERWKSGIEKVTPLQNTKVTLIGQVIVLTGIVLGIIVNIVFSIWWLVVILIGSLIISLMATLGTYQKYITLNKMEKMMQEVKNDDE